MGISKSYALKNGVEIPRLGLGVFKSEQAECVNSVKWALEMGYRHVDTAQFYFNEKEVAEGIKASGVPRSEVFITTKIWNDNIRAGKILETFNESLRLLDTDYLDLLLIHWPVEGKEAAWKIMEKLYKEGKIRAVGVSNFHKKHMEELLAVAEIVPMINQVEMHPYLVQKELRAYNESLGIATETWSPLGRGNSLSDPVIAEIASSKEKTTAQVVLRWHLQHGCITIPKSVRKERIGENMDVFDFELSEKEMESIDNLNKGLRVSASPDDFDF